MHLLGRTDDEGCADFRNKYTTADGIAAITSLLMRLVPELEAAGITLLLEPLNNHGTDHGMSVTDTEEGAAIVRAVNSEHVRLLLDAFHMQLMHGNLWKHIRENLDIVPYIHLADVPGRHEAGTGEINFRYLLQMRERTPAFIGGSTFTREYGLSPRSYRKKETIAHHQSTEPVMDERKYEG